VTFRQILITINVLAVLAAIGIVVYRVISVRRNPPVADPPNLTPFLDDQDLEGRRLERVLGWCLFFTCVIALSLPLYFLFEPGRQSSALDAFDERAVERGATFYANASMPEYDATKSLLCADCHGTDLTGGSAPIVLRSEDPTCDVDAEPSAERPECLPQPVTWKAPALDTVMMRYVDEALPESTPEEFNRKYAAIREILIYGRPGTPMPAWGVESNKGVLNDQGINDLIAFLDHRQISPEDAQRRSAQELDDYRQQAIDNVEANQAELTDAQAALAERPDDPDLQADVQVAQRNLDYSIAWRTQTEASGDGTLLFQLQCARCHTKNWSFFNPAEAPLYEWMAPGPQGGGAYGPNLTGGSEVRQFPGPGGSDNQYTFVATGVPRGEQYGVRGISSGRMPFFVNMITEAQIRAIVEYERGL
jgi:mono/diheme cytochrome c family protein